MLGTISKKLDDCLRFQDLAWRRTEGGYLKWFGINRYSPGAVLLPALLCWGLVTGSPLWEPRMKIGIAAAVLAAALLLGAFALSAKRRWPVNVDFGVQFVVVLLVCAGVWIWGPSKYQPYPYKHVLIPLTVTTAAALLVAILLLRVLKPPPGVDLAERLKFTELFELREDIPSGSALSVAASVATILKTGLLYLFWPPSFAALMADPAELRVPDFVTKLLLHWNLPEPAWTQVFFLVFLLGSLLALILASLNPRFDTMWTLLAGSFFRGGALPVSLAVIVLGAGRFFGVSYITTVFDTPERWVFTRWLTIFYFLAWWFDYWKNRLLGEKLLELIQADAEHRSFRAYPIEQAQALRNAGGHISVPIDGRSLQIHGSRRFLAIREWPGHPHPFFQAHTVASLLDRLSDKNAGPEQAETARSWQTRILGYQFVVGAIALILPAILGWELHQGTQQAEAVVSGSGGTVDLVNQLFTGDCGGGRPAVLVAASGGGTRAALYTTVMLEAIAREGHALDRVVAASGVSGGGMSLAYFASRRPKLVAMDSEEWGHYFQAMEEPYILTALHRAAEWNMVADGRLGQALADSFETAWGKEGPRKTMGEITDFGLILNSTLAGSFDKRDVPASRRSEPLIDLEREYRDRTRSELSGARLIMTNLKLKDGFGGHIQEPRGHEGPPVVVDAPTLELWKAAALNANFPPVFSDSAIDSNERTRYWVTDGGAADNRGLEMLLTALRDAVAGGQWKQCKERPRILVLVVDAGAFSNAFSQDRGVLAAKNAGSQFASALSGELLASITATYRSQPTDDGRVDFFYVPMPLPLRIAWGTHWMLQDSITVRSPEGSKLALKNITGLTAIDVLRSVHGSAQTGEAEVLKWVQDDCWHKTQWGRFLTALGVAVPAAEACEFSMPAPGAPD